MRLMLVNPVARKTEPPRYFPLGLGQIAALAQRAGFEVEVFDLNALRLGEAEVESRIAALRADVFGLTELITGYRDLRYLVELLRRYHPGKPIILGGGLASSYPEYVMTHTAVDLVVPGEGDAVIVPLLRALRDRTPLAAVPGILYRDGGAIRRNPSPPVVTNLDELPFPNRDLFPVDIYLENMERVWLFSRPTRSLSMITSRGCPFRCIYCDKSIWGGRFRQRSVDCVIREIETLIAAYGLEGVLFADDTFVLKKKWVLEFCAALRERLPGFRWSANGRVGVLDEEMLAAMAAAGCDTLGFGIESGSQLILDEMRKDVRVEVAKQTILNTRNAGIRPIAYITIGSFSETRETVRETIRFLKETGLKSGANFLTPFPGSPLFDEAVARGKLNLSTEELLNNWEAWNQSMLVNLTNLSDAELIEMPQLITVASGAVKNSLASRAQQLSTKKQQELWHMVLQRMSAAGHSRFVLFGAGAHTRRFLEWYAGQAETEVIAVFDQDPAKADPRGIGGVPIVNHLPEGGETGAVLLSSDAWEDQMFAEARLLFPASVTIYRIYG